MKQSSLWLGVFACTSVIARPVPYSNDLSISSNTAYLPTEASNWPTDTNIALDSSSPYDSFTVAANEDKPRPRKTPKPAQPQPRERLQRRLKGVIRDVYEGMYEDTVVTDVSGMLDQETINFLDGKIKDKIRQEHNRLHDLPVPDESAEGSTIREESGPEKNPLAIQGLTEESLMKFVLVVISVAPQAGIELKGIELTGAVFEALPGFLKSLNGWWNPSGGI